MTLKEQIIVAVLLDEPLNDLLEDLAKVYHIKITRPKRTKKRQKALVDFIKNDKPMNEIISNLYFVD